MFNFAHMRHLIEFSSNIQKTELTAFTLEPGKNSKERGTPGLGDLNSSNTNERASAINMRSREQVTHKKYLSIPLLMQLNQTKQ